MDVNAFRKSPAGKLIEVGQGDASYRAFVPNPLPPKLAPDGELLRSASSAAYSVGELAALGRLMPNPHLLIGPFMRREAVLSSRIEGTQSDIADIYAYEAGQAPRPGMDSPPAADMQEVLNYVRALEHGLERLATLPVSLRLIRELHEQLVQGVRGGHAAPGEFRRSQNWIGRPGCTLNEADFVPPPVLEMHETLGLLEQYLHAEGDDHPPLIRLAFIHYQFETIHPFVDGNGRIGRLLIALLLVHWGLLPLPLLYLSDYFERHRQEYYDQLMAVSRYGTWRDWTLFFLAGVEDQARDASIRAKHLQDLRRSWQDRLAQARSSALPLRLAEALFDSPILTIPQAQRILDVTYVSAQRNVEKLVEAGILKQLGTSTYDRTYAALGILNIISERRG